MEKKLAPLVFALREHEQELRADLQQYYGIDLDHAMRGEHTAGHISALIMGLPQDARLRVAVNEDARWTPELTLQAMLFNSFNMFVYGMSDKRKRGTKPPKVGPSYMKNEATKAPAQVMTIDELIEQLSYPRIEDTWQAEKM